MLWRSLNKINHSKYLWNYLCMTQRFDRPITFFYRIHAYCINVHIPFMVLQLRKPHQKICTRLVTKKINELILKGKRIVASFREVMNQSYP